MSTAGKLKVIDSVIENILEDGVHINMTAGQLTATIDKTRIMNCDQDGIDTTGNTRGALSNCLIAHNTTSGVKASATNTQLNIDDSQILFSSVGVQSIAGSAIRVSDSIIAQNGTGLNPNGGTIDSFQGNSLIGNTAPGRSRRLQTNSSSDARGCWWLTANFREIRRAVTRASMVMRRGVASRHPRPRCILLPRVRSASSRP